MTRMTHHLTGQRTLERSALSVTIDPTGDGPPRLSARLSRELDGLDSQGRLLLEPHVRTLSMQLSMGTVGAPQELEEVPLPDFPDPDPVRLRLAVLAPDSPLLLAAADKIRPDILGQDGRSRGILRTQLAELGQRSWNLVFHDDGPLLEINHRHDPKAMWLRQAEVVGLVLPEVCLRVLQWAASQEDEGEGPGDPIHDWLAFGRELGLPARPSYDDQEAVREWAERGARTFAERHRALDRLPGMLEEGE